MSDRESSPQCSTIAGEAKRKCSTPDRRGEVFVQEEKAISKVVIGLSGRSLRKRRPADMIHGALWLDSDPVPMTL
jgi:hypothetical protein